MHCTHCHNAMLIAESIQEHNTEQVRYQCPVCGQRQMVTRLRMITSRSMHQSLMTTGKSRVYR
ncbi:hypothetical protein [Solemya velum gill symbiont]|uniref:hypothetical protein n=1 Tax=Solemya velum gill symbiont TaxID=2340 RepID=UPI001179B9C4|nr:hypothetical protein [Solemya velum gill symbiont]